MNRYDSPSFSSSSPSSSFLGSFWKGGAPITTSTWVILGIIALFVLLSVLYYMYYVKSSFFSSSSSSSSSPNQEGQSRQPGSGTAEVLFFYTDWCPHCKTAKPIWEEVKTEYEHKTIHGYRVSFVSVDCSEESAEVEKLMNQYSVEGYPTIKLIKDGQVIDFDAKPSKESLTTFLTTVL